MSNFVFLAATLKSLSACRIEFSHLRIETRLSLSGTVFLRGLLNVREKQILTSVIEIQNENWG